MTRRWRVPIVDRPRMDVGRGRPYMKNNAGTGAPRIGTACDSQQYYQTNTRQKRKKSMFHGVLRVIKIVVGWIMGWLDKCQIGTK